MLIMFVLAQRKSERERETERESERAEGRKEGRKATTQMWVSFGIRR